MMSMTTWCMVPNVKLYNVKPVAGACNYLISVSDLLETMQHLQSSANVLKKYALTKNDFYFILLTISFTKLTLHLQNVSINIGHSFLSVFYQQTMKIFTQFGSYFIHGLTQNFNYVHLNIRNCTMVMRSWLQVIQSAPSCMFANISCLRALRVCLTFLCGRKGSE